MSFNILLKDIIDNFNSNFKFKLKIGFFKPEYTCFIIIFLKQSILSVKIISDLKTFIIKQAD